MSELFGSASVVDGAVEGTSEEVREVARRLADEIFALLPGARSRRLKLSREVTSSAHTAEPWFVLQVGADTQAANRQPPALWGCRKPTIKAIIAEALTQGVHTLVAELEGTRTAKPVTELLRGSVVFEPQLAAALLHTAIGHTCETDNFVSYRDRLGIGFGETWTPRAALTVFDDPTQSVRSGGYDVDDEGTRSQPTKLIESGVWTGLLASKEHRASEHDVLHGNGRRAVGSRRVTPRNSVFYAENGTAGRDELISSIDDGYYCGGPRLNLSIEDGVLLHATWARRIRHGHLTDETYSEVEIRARKAQLMRRLVGIANDRTWYDSCWPCEKNGDEVLVTLASPHLMFENIYLYPREFHTPQ